MVRPLSGRAFSGNGRRPLCSPSGPGGRTPADAGAPGPYCRRLTRLRLAGSSQVPPEPASPETHDAGQRRPRGEGTSESHIGQHLVFDAGRISEGRRARGTNDANDANDANGRVALGKHSAARREPRHRTRPCGGRHVPRALLSPRRPRTRQRLARRFRPQRQTPSGLSTSASRRPTILSHFGPESRTAPERSYLHYFSHRMTTPLHEVFR